MPLAVRRCWFYSATSSLPVYPVGILVESWLAVWLYAGGVSHTEPGMWPGWACNSHDQIPGRPAWINPDLICCHILARIFPPDAGAIIHRTIVSDYLPILANHNVTYAIRILIHESGNYTLDLYRSLVFNLLDPCPAITPLKTSALSGSFLSDQLCHPIFPAHRSAYVVCIPNGVVAAAREYWLFISIHRQDCSTFNRDYSDLALFNMHSAGNHSAIETLIPAFTEIYCILQQLISKQSFLPVIMSMFGKPDILPYWV